LKKIVKKIQKFLFNTEVGIVFWVFIGVVILFFFLKTRKPTPYIFAILGPPILFYIKKQDWLPYIYGGIILALLLQFIFSIVLSTNLPAVVIVSGSMDHGITSTYPCHKMVSSYKESFDSWWDLCGESYSSFNITKEVFSNFPFRNGIKAGDIAIVKGLKTYEVGDIIVYNAGQAAPIIHRIVKINDGGTYQTKGDHNPGQNPYEIRVTPEQIEGKVIFLIPRIGYPKVLVVRIIGV